MTIVPWSLPRPAPLAPVVRHLPSFPVALPLGLARPTFQHFHRHFLTSYDNNQ